MPELLEHSKQRKLRPGDVLMVSRVLKRSPAVGRYKDVTWRFFAVVITHKKWRIDARRVGAPRGKEDIVIEFDDLWTIQYLPQDEWPDGVHVFRMQMVLTGKIPDIV